MTGKVHSKPEHTRESILYHLKTRGEMTAAQICQAVDITYMGVKRYLSEFQAEGLVDSEIISGGRGRPFYKYRLTQKAMELFPSGYETMLGDVLAAICEESGQVGVMNLLALRNKRLVNNLLERFEGKSLKDRVRELACVFAENGYMTEFEALPDGNYLIYQRHCPLNKIASHYQQLCALEPQLMMDLLGAKVIRQSHMLKNEPVCGYLVVGASAEQNEKTG